MNSYATLTFIFTLFTVISSSILYASFRNRMDASGVYFLISELCTTASCGALFLINIKLVDTTPPWTGIPLLSALCAEVAILFSVLSLTSKIEKKWFFAAISGVALIAIILEINRNALQPRTFILIYSLCLTSLFLLNYLVCKYWLPIELRKNQFIKWLTWFELGMVGYGVVRILGYFSHEPIRPWDTPSPLAITIFSFYLVLATFRYISYIGLRITWISPISQLPNSLNKTLSNVVNEKAQLLRGLIASNRVIGISALASSLAHQLSQPLTTIALLADTTRRDLGQHNNPDIKISLDEISDQSKKLAELVKNLRKLFSSNDFEFAEISLEKMTDEVLEIVQPSFDAKKITLIKKYEGNPIIFGDSIQLQQVLINIFNNAIDALTINGIKDKKINISITKHLGFASIEIKDNGGGIDPKLLPNIFDLYKTTKQSGLGVGLWLSKTIVEQHHGKILASTDENSGATFKIEIPIRPCLESKQ